MISSPWNSFSTNVVALHKRSQIAEKWCFQRQLNKSDFPPKMRVANPLIARVMPSCCAYDCNGTLHSSMRAISLLTCVIAQAHTIAFLCPSPLWVSFLHMLCQDLCSHFSCSRMPKLTPLYGRSVIRSLDKRNFLGSIGYQYKLHMDL